MADEEPILSDDGETGGARKILSYLEELGIDNVGVVASRWYGLIQLGAIRFQHYKDGVLQAAVKAGLVTSNRPKVHINVPTSNTFDPLAKEWSASSHPIKLPGKPVKPADPPSASGMQPSNREVWIIGDSIVRRINKNYVAPQKTSQLTCFNLEYATQCMLESKFYRRHIIISLGFNDLKSENADAVIDNIDSLVQICKQKHAGVIIYLCTVPLNPQSQNASHTNKLNDHIKLLCRGDSRIHLIQLSAALRDVSLMSDGIHPNAAGIRVIERLFSSALPRKFTPQSKVELDKPQRHQNQARPRPSPISPSTAVQSPKSSSTVPQQCNPTSQPNPTMMAPPSSQWVQQSCDQYGTPFYGPGYPTAPPSATSSPNPHLDPSAPRAHYGYPVNPFINNFTNGIFPQVPVPQNPYHTFNHYWPLMAQA